jgi:hypothetical protein
MENGVPPAGWVGLGGLLVAIFRWLASSISGEGSRREKLVDLGKKHESLTQRVDGIDDEVAELKQKSVSREELDGRLTRMEHNSDRILNLVIALITGKKIDTNQLL